MTTKALTSSSSLRRRRLRRAAAVVGVVVLATLLVLTLLNRRWAVLVGRASPSAQRFWAISNGAFSGSWADMSGGPVAVQDLGWNWTLVRCRTPQDPNFLPIDWMPRWINKSKNRLLIVPFWTVGIPATGLLAWGWFGLRRLVPGKCPDCGYDVRGLPGSARCPECGGSVHG